MQKPTLLLASLLIVMAGCKQKKDTLDLQLKLNKGDRYHYTIVMDQSMASAMAGENNTAVSMGYQFEVTEDSAGWKKVNATYDDIKLDIKANGMTMNFSSASNDTTGPMGIMNKAFKALSGGKFTFTVNQKGEIGRVSGVEQIMQNLSNTLPPEAGSMLAGMRSSFSDEQIKQTFTQSFKIVPDTPVTVGQSWNKPLNFEMMGFNFSNNNKYTLLEVKGDEAKLKVDAVLNGSGSSQMTGTSTGFTYIDTNTGMVNKSEITSNIKVSVQGAGDNTLKQKMTITSKKL
jgi:hypothetical protein